MSVIGQGVVLIVSLIIIIALMMVVCMLYKKHKNNTNKRDEDVAIPLINRIDPNTNEPETGDAILDKPTQPVDSSKVNKQGEISVIIVVAHLSDPNLNNIVMFTA